MNLTDIDLKLLKLFVTVVRCGGFTPAQAHLNVTQSTVSNHMRALEERLGLRLCERGRAGFRLTLQGRQIYEATESLLRSIDAFRSEALSLKGELAGDLRIGLVDNMIGDEASPLIDALREVAGFGPRLHPHLVIADPQTLELEVTSGRLDAAIGVFPAPISSLQRLPFHTEEQGFYCGEAHALFDRPEGAISLDQIRGSRVISRSYWHLSDLERLGMREAAAVANSMEAALALVLTGAFLGFLPVHLAQPWEQRKRLRRLMNHDLGYKAEIVVLYRGSADRHPLISAFLEACRRARASNIRVGRGSGRSRSARGARAPC